MSIVEVINVSEIVAKRMFTVGTLVLMCLLMDSCESLPAIPLSEEKILIQALISRYASVTKHGRPVTMVTTPVNVQYGLGLIQMDLDEKARALVLSVWIKMVWKDEYLIWKPEDFSNISEVKMESKLLWLPDIMLYNTAETETLLRDTFITVFYNGTVLWVPHQKLKSSCSIDVTDFPFDAQTCHLWFGSWTYTTRYLNLTMAFPDGIDLNTYSSDYKESGQWKIMKLQARRRVLPSVDDDPNYSVLTFTLTLRRNIVFASYILTLPCVFLACLTLVVFWLPPDRPDRTALAMSTFSSFLLLLLILVEAAPPTASSVPRLGIYYCFNMVIIMLSIFLSSLVVNVYRMGEGCTPVPRWLRKITINTPLKRLCFSEGFLAVTWISDYEQSSSYPGETNRESSFPLLNDGSGPTRRTESADYHAHQNINQSNGTTSIGMRNMTTSAFPNHVYQHQLEEVTSCRVSNLGYGSSVESDVNGQLASSNSTIRAQIALNVGSITELLRKLDKRMSRRIYHDTEQQVSRRDWRKVALILDRVFFLLYFFLIVMSVSTLFPRP